MLTFNNTRSSHKRNRTAKKFPRHKLKDFNTIPKNLKEWGYCKHNWNDDDYTYTKGNMKRFLMSNLGKPIDTVYSKFLKRWKSFENPKEEFYRWIKDSIVESIGGFYLVNGILSYKKPNKAKKETNVFQENIKKFQQLDLKSLLKILIELKVPQCLGVFKVHGGEKTIYMDFYPNYNSEDADKWKLRQITSIEGVGYGINYDVINFQTGKTKYLFEVSNNFFASKTGICFYYKL